MTQETTASIQEAIQHVGFVVRPVVGTSMMPLLDQNTDTVRLVALTRPLVKYDVPLYVRPGGEHVLHRIVKVCEGYYVIRGDNTNYTEKVPFSWVIAVADGCSKNGVWHSFQERSMIQYAVRIVRYWHLRNFYRKIKGCFVRCGRAVKRVVGRKA